MADENIPYLSSSTTGAIGELIATIWLLKQGYEVYRNVPATGKFDIIAIKGDEIKKIDVTASLSRERYFSSKKAKTAKKQGGYLLYVFPNGECKWSAEHEASVFNHVCLVCTKKFTSKKEKRATCGSMYCMAKRRTEKAKAEHDKKRARL